MLTPDEMRRAFRNYATAPAKAWYRISNSSGAGRTSVSIYDIIGFTGVTAGDFVRELGDVTGGIDLHIHSEGGEIFDGKTIYNALASRQDVAVYIDGLAASAASFIAQAASPGKLFMAKNATMMIHDGQTLVMGSPAELQSLIDILNKESDIIAGIYAERSGKPASYFRDKMRDETWYNAAEALEERLVDSIFDPRTGKVMNEADLALLMAASGKSKNDNDGDEGEGNGWRMRNGKWVYDPDNDGDDDSSAEGDTDHDTYDENGKLRPGKKIPPRPSSGNSSDVDLFALMDHLLVTDFTDILNWDAAAAFAKCHSAGDFRSICAGEHTSGDPDTQAHWALPHHNSPGGPPDKGGVSAALGRANQTEQLKNKDAALSHLRAHARALGMPSGDKTSQADWSPTDDEVTKMIEALRG